MHYLLVSNFYLLASNQTTLIVNYLRVTVLVYNYMLIHNSNVSDCGYSITST